MLSSKIAVLVALWLTCATFGGWEYRVEAMAALRVTVRISNNDETNREDIVSKLKGYWASVVSNVFLSVYW